MLEQAENALRHFHYHMAISGSCYMPQEPLSHGGLHQWYQMTKALSEEFESHLSDPDCDPRYLRAHLILEEVSEMLCAMFNGDAVEVLDGIADALYVIIGTGVQFRMPVAEAFNEVHQSNMSKQPKNGPRLRDKGPNYRPPDLESLMLASYPGLIQLSKKEAS